MEEVLLAAGESSELRVYLVDANGDAAEEAETADLTWSSSEPEVVEVESGTVTGRLSGEATVEAEHSSGHTATADATVGPGPAETLDVTPDSSVVAVDDTVRLEASPEDAYGNALEEPALGWETADSDVATVTEDGLVQGRAEGATAITATVGDVEEQAHIEVLSDGEAFPSEPGTVTDLAVAAVTETTVTLTWTEVDDGVGEGAYYAVRWHEHPIEWNWGAATEVDEGECAFPLEGSAPGEPLSCTIEDLEPDTRLDFQVVAFRESDGERVYGDLSNVATGTPGQPPAASVEASPTEIEFTALDETHHLDATAYDDEGEPMPDAQLDWESGEPEVATVDEEGTVTARGVGSTVVLLSAASSGVADSVDVLVAQEPFEVEVTPSEITLEEGDHATLSASISDANGFTIHNAHPDEWSASDPAVATVDDTGTVNAVSRGTTEVTASFDGGPSGSATVSVVDEGESGDDPGRSADRPNEPSNYEPWFSHDWRTFPDSPHQGMTASDQGAFGPGNEGGFDRATLIEDPDAPHGFDRSVRVTVPEGHRAGTGVLNFNPASCAESYTASCHEPGLEEIYISYWVLFESNPGDGRWEMPGAGWRFFSINRHVNDECTLNTEFGWSVRGTQGPQDSFHSWWLWGHPSCDWDGSAQTLTTTSPGPELDTWYHVEMLVKREGVGEESWLRDGSSRFRVWVNQEPLLDESIEHKWDGAIKQLHWNANPSGTWTDGSIHKTRDDHFRFSGLYVSGVPMEGR